MEKKVFYGLVVMLMYLVGSGFSQGEVKNEEAEWEQFLMEAQRPIVLTITSSLCGLPCAILEDQVTQLAKTYGDHIIFYKANILKKPFFAKLYKVLSVPTLIVFKGGIEIKRLEKDFYWGSAYDLIFKANIFCSASAPSDSAPSPAPSDSAPAPSDSAWNGSLLIESLEEVRSSWEDILVETQVPIVLTITSSLCGVPCVILNDQVARLADTYGEQVKFYTADILENPFVATLYHLLNVPTVIVFKDGKEIFRFEKLSDWGNIYELIFQSIISDSASPSPSPF